MTRGHILLIIMVMAAALVNAQESVEGMKLLGAGLAIGLAAIGAGIAIGLIGAASISGLIEKPEYRVWYLIFIALGEALAIYGLLISLMLMG